MKNILLLPGILTCLFASFAPAQLIDANDRVRIEVKVDTATDQKDLARTSTDRVTQHKTLNISLSGKAKNPEARVVKWTAYGSNQRTEDVKALETGEAKLALDERGSQAIKTKTITTTYTPDHTEGRALRPRAPGRPRSV